jgi:ABC-type nitrate/sulfonate/bicarbonate transport system permease component
VTVVSPLPTRQTLTDQLARPSFVLGFGVGFVIGLLLGILMTEAATVLVLKP